MSLARAEAARFRREGGFYLFVREALPIIEPAMVFCPNWHIELMCKSVEAIAFGRIRKLVCNVPPGSFKSTIYSVMWNAWEWTIEPSHRYLYTSFDGGLTMRDADHVRTIILSDWYKARFGDRITIDPGDPVGEFWTIDPGTGKRLGGWRFSTSVGGKATGWHPTRRVMDDPVKPLGATIENLDNAKKYYQGTLSKRGNPATVATACVMQRLHEEDPSGYLLSTDPEFEHLRLPLEYIEDEPCVTSFGADPRTEEGESIDEKRITPRVIAQIKTDTPDDATYSAQMQQNTRTASGNIFKDEYFLNTYDEIPNVPNAIWMQSWDCTFKDGVDSDFVAGLTAIYIAPKIYLINMVKGKMSFTATEDAVVDGRTKFPRVYLTCVENKANGIGICDRLEKIHRWSGVQRITPIASKADRARFVTPWFAAGNVLLPKNAPWVVDYKAELKAFPRIKRDDQVDATSQLIAYVMEILGGASPPNYKNAKGKYGRAFGYGNK